METSIEAENAERDCEKLSYTPYAYKRLLKLRENGRKRGIKVPYLSFELTKPEEPRVSVLVAAIIAAILLVALVMFLIWACYALAVLFIGAGELNALLRGLSDPAAYGGGLFWASFIIAAAEFSALVILVPTLIAVQVFRFLRDVIYMAQCSKEEFAKGDIVASRVAGLIITLSVSTLVFVFMLCLGMINTYPLLILAYVGIVVLCGMALVIIGIEKRKCVKWFNELDGYRKEDFLAQARALESVKNRLHTEKKMKQDQF